ncbi:hypothetical protein [Pseudomonas sp. Gutcm_11s]|uniref:hypothetical protein n=1 Tax=Pseudomonas sp. Gutcm_11s TaxID=3026088 RepID=UPI00235E28D7|nr:hypothetical protein [Pseudomonas sp. Gutcm_11s]MDD0841275.1 hypothetical protein [Pseudomonas sp. Gutcm_11s]
MRLIITVILGLFAPVLTAAPLVDPWAIMAESPDMLDPEDVYTSCSDNRFVISLDAVNAPSEKATALPVKSPPWEKEIRCTLNGREITSTLTVAEPRPTGICGATHHIEGNLAVDNARLLGNSNFANYCSMSGISSLSLKTRTDGGLAELIICTYESGHGNTSATHVYACRSYDADALMAKGVTLTDGGLDNNAQTAKP